MKTLRAIAALGVVGTAFVFAIGQKVDPQDPLNYRLSVFQVKDMGIIDAISQLSSEPIEGLQLGVEEVLRERVQDPAPQDPHFSLLLRTNTVKEILDVICSYDNRYMWSQDGRTINVYPKVTVDDRSYLLNRTLKYIGVSAIPNPEAGLTFLD